MSAPFSHLTVESVKAIHNQVLAAHGGSSGLRDEALLESALGAIQATVGGKQLLATPVEIASGYLSYLCRNHPFVDGNKRTALAACLVFLSENTMLANEILDADGWENLTLDIASGKIDRQQTSKRIAKLLSSKSR